MLLKIQDGKGVQRTPTFIFAFFFGALQNSGGKGDPPVLTIASVTSSEPGIDSKVTVCALGLTAALRQHLNRSPIQVLAELNVA